MEEQSGPMRSNFMEEIGNGNIKDDERVVVNCTGHTFPVEKHVLGDQWAVDVHLSKDQSAAPREGLQAA